MKVGDTASIAQTRFLDLLDQGLEENADVLTGLAKPLRHDLAETTINDDGVLRERIGEPFERLSIELEQLAIGIGDRGCRAQRCESNSANSPKHACSSLSVATVYCSPAGVLVSIRTVPLNIISIESPSSPSRRMTLPDWKLTARKHSERNVTARSSALRKPKSSDDRMQSATSAGRVVMRPRLSSPARR